MSDKTGQTSKNAKHRGGVRSKASLVTLGLALALGTGACRTSSEDVQRWARTVQGPKKLVAVLTHDKYPLELRVESALALIRMKPRNGRRVGIDGTAKQVLAPATGGDRRTREQQGRSPIARRTHAKAPPD